MEIPHALGVALRWLGILLIVFAIADIGLSYAGFDITGVRWSPIVSGITGGLLMRFFGGDDDE